MTVFDQRGQQVTYQYNAAGDINFGAVQNRVELVQELEKFQTEMTQAIKEGIFNEEVATDTEYQLKKAIQHAKKPEPDKTSILEHLSNVKELMQGVTAASGLFTGLVKATELVQKFF